MNFKSYEIRGVNLLKNMQDKRKYQHLCLFLAVRFPEREVA